ncbi:hypothetical protein M0R04_11545 [Candidatus Dojkabacteria bacterium]|jgi:hypothetical protein|nr:hypothetical protein [Candidatus Dojkabacteria bacterium]
MELYATYLKELYGRDIIYNDHAFITYNAYEDNSLYIHSIYVKDEYRALGEGSKLEQELILKYKPLLVTCFVDLTTGDPTLSLKVILSRGYIIDVVDNTKITLFKNLYYNNSDIIKHDKENANNIYLPELNHEY